MLLTTTNTIAPNVIKDYPSVELLEALSWLQKIP